MTKTPKCKGFRYVAWGDGSYRTRPENAGDTFSTPDELGPFTVASYTSGMSTTGLGSVRIYYPVGLASPAPATIWMGGLSNDINQAVEESGGYTWSDNFEFGIGLASHGIPSMHVNPPDLGADPTGRETAFDAAITSLLAENTRSGGQLYGRLQTNKLVLMGHSFGAGGAFRAAAGNANVAGVIGVAPVFNGQGYPTALDKPSMFFNSSDDGLENYSTVYSSISSSYAKIRAEYGSPTGYETGHDAGRAIWSSIVRSVAGTTLEHSIDAVMRKLITSFVKYYAAGQSDYKPYLATGSGLSGFTYNDV